MKPKAQRWVMTAERKVVLEDFEFDPVLGPREVAVRTLCTAISPGTECANYLGLDPDTRRPGAWCAYPWKPGYTGVGEILAVGREITEYRVGDRVVGMLRHASHSVANADETLGLADPALQPEHAAYVRLFNIATTAVQALAVQPFETAGVWGLGTIGNLVAQCLHQAGYQVVGIDPLADRRALAERCAIPLTLDPQAPDFRGHILGLTRQTGLDVAVDSTGHAPTTIEIPSFVRTRGQLVLMTHWRSQPLVDASPLVNTVFVRGIRLVGALEVAIGAEPFHDWAALQRHKLAVIQRQIAAGRLHVAPLISHVVNPAQCTAAYEGLCFDKARWSGVVVDWR